MSRAREAARLIGNNTFTIDSSNNIGIGSTVPASKLDLSGNYRVSGIATASRVDVSGVTTSQHLQVTGVTTAVNINASGIITATSFVGSGSSLTGLPAGFNELDGMLFM